MVEEDFCPLHKECYIDCKDSKLCYQNYRNCQEYITRQEEPSDLEENINNGK